MRAPRLARRLSLAAAVGVGLGALGCGEAPPVGAVAYPERSLSYAPLLLAVKRGLYGETPVRLALAQLSAPGAVARAVAGGAALAGAMAMADFIAAVADGAPLIAFGALTSRLDCHLVTTTARSLPVPSLPALHLGDWRGLRVGVESGPDGTEAFVRLFAMWSGVAPRAPAREVAMGHQVDGETRWAGFETDEGLAAALADRRLEAFVGRAYAAAQTVSYGSGRVVSSLADGGGAHVLEALPTLVVTRTSGLSANNERLLTQIHGALGRAVDDLTGASGREAAALALPEKDSLHRSLAHGLISPSVASGAYAQGARLGREAVARYVELSTMTGARLDVNVGAVTTTRFSG